MQMSNAGCTLASGFIEFNCHYPKYLRFSRIFEDFQGLICINLHKFASICINLHQSSLADNSTRWQQRLAPVIYEQLPSEWLRPFATLQRCTIDLFTARFVHCQLGNLSAIIRQLFSAHFRKSRSAGCRRGNAAWPGRSAGRSNRAPNPGHVTFLKTFDIPTFQVFILQRILWRLNMFLLLMALKSILIELFAFYVYPLKSINLMKLPSNHNVNRLGENRTLLKQSSATFQR